MEFQINLGDGLRRVVRIVKLGGERVKLDNLVTGGAFSRGRCGCRFQCHAHFRQMVHEDFIEACLEAPCQHIGIEEIPTRMAQNTGADLGLGFDEALGGKGFHRLAQNGAGNAEAQRQFMIARKDGPCRNGSRDDAAAQFTHHDSVAVMAFASGYGRFQQSQFRPPSFVAWLAICFNAHLARKPVPTFRDAP